MTAFGDWLRAQWWVLLLLLVTEAGTLGRWHDHARAGSGILAALAVLVLLVRQRRPELSWLGNVVAVTAYFALGYDDGPVYLSVFCAAYALTSRLPARRWLPYTVGVVPIALSTTIHRDAGSFGASVAWFTWFVAVAFGAAAVGAAMRTRGETRREQARRAATEEQLRTARDLHDGVGHGLAVIAMQAGVALHVLDRDPAKARESLMAIRESSRESLNALRVELSRLSPESGEGQRTVRNGLRDVPRLVGRVRAGGLDVDLLMDGVTVDEVAVDEVAVDEVAVDDEVGAVAYLVVQEALTNVLRHSGASTAQVEIGTVSGALQVRVTDDGHGRPAGEAGEGLGLSSMRARVERLGGTLAVGATGRAFEVRASIPTVTS